MLHVYRTRAYHLGLLARPYASSEIDLSWDICQGVSLLFSLSSDRWSKRYFGLATNKTDFVSIFDALYPEWGLLGGGTK